jgi:hypothetical protein
MGLSPALMFSCGKLFVAKHAGQWIEAGFDMLLPINLA